MCCAGIAPWFTVELGQRIPARASTPAPSVDGGLLTIARREAPLLPRQQRKTFQAMAYQVFTGRGRDIVEITTRAGIFDRSRDARKWAAASGLDPQALPKHLSTQQWIELYRSSATARP